jgi:hypothetical protein
VTEIGGSAFQDCSGLASVTIPNSVTEISSWTFYGCRGLISVTIGNKVDSIGYGAFAGCKKLSDVYFWRNPRLDVLEWAVKDGKPCKVQKYPRATTGEALYKSLCTIRDKYGVDFHFCNKSDTGFEIKRLLGE